MGIKLWSHRDAQMTKAVVLWPFVTQVQTEGCSPPPLDSFPSSVLPLLSMFLFLPAQHVFPALLADRPADVTVSCLVRLSSFGSEQVEADCH